MGRIVAISGGNLETTHRINQYIVDLAGKEKANLLFIGTASRDAENYIFSIRGEFESLGCAVKDLSLTAKEYHDDEIDGLLNQADIIYIGGGDTAFMMDSWKKYSLAYKLKEIYRKDQAVLSGISAGAMCWFNCGHSDSAIFWKNNTVGYGWVDGLLGIHAFAFCPHYDDKRAESFDKMIREKPFPGIALEENVAFVEKNGCIDFIAPDDSSTAYIVKYVDGRLVKQRQKVAAI